MEFKLNFNMNNAAFEDEPQFEVREILKEVGRQVIHGRTIAPQTNGTIRDINGNKIGKWEIRED